MDVVTITCIQQSPLKNGYMKKLALNSEMQKQLETFLRVKVDFFVHFQNCTRVIYKVHITLPYVQCGVFGTEII